jgi:hypothetical protein
MNILLPEVTELLEKISKYLATQEKRVGERDRTTLLTRLGFLGDRVFAVPGPPWQAYRVLHPPHLYHYTTGKTFIRIIGHAIWVEHSLPLSIPWWLPS